MKAHQVITGIIASVAVVTLILLSFVSIGNNRAESSEIRSLRSQESAQVSEIKSLNSQLGNVTSQLSSVTSQINSLDMPSDPLSSYNQECEIVSSELFVIPSSMTDNEIVYLPCTSNAETIPQPGQ